VPEAPRGRRQTAGGLATPLEMPTPRPKTVPPLARDDAYAGASLLDDVYSKLPRLGGDRAGKQDDEADVLRPVPVDPGWSADLRRIAVFGSWLLPLGALLLAVSALWGWPETTSVTTHPGVWAAFTAAGIAVVLLGTLAVSALLTATRGRRWAAFGTMSMMVGALLVAPMIGIVGIARPATSRVEPFGPRSNALQRDLTGSLAARGLVWLGLAFVTIGLIALAVAVIRSKMLSRADAYLFLAAGLVAVASAALGWEFLLVVAAMALFAAGLGLAWTAIRVTPDLRTPVRLSRRS
jgi:hypothetical protein